MNSKTQAGNSRLSVWFDRGELGLLLALVLFAPIYLLRFRIGVLPSNGLEALVALFGLGWLGNKILTKKPIHYLKQMALVLALILFAGVISAFVPEVSRVSLGQFKGFLLEPVLVALLVFDICSARGNRFLLWGRAHRIDRLLQIGYIVSALTVAGLAIVQASLHQAGPDGRFLSVFKYEVAPSANYLAFYLVPAGALALGLVLAPNANCLKRLIFTLAAVIIAFGVYLSASRSGLLALGVSSMSGLIIISPRKASKILLGILLVAGLLGIFFVSRPDLSASPDSGRVASSNNIRLEIWRTSAEILLKNPRNFALGVGLGNFQNYFSALTQERVNYHEFIAPRALHPHNLELALWLNLGLMGLFAMGLWFYLVLRALSKAPKKLPYLLLTISFLVLGLFDTPFFKNDLGLIFFIFSALSLVSKKSKLQVAKLKLVS